MAHALLKGISEYIPLNTAVNYIFKQVLSQYVIINENDTNTIDEAKNDNSFKKLNNLRINAAEINSTYLQHSPITIKSGEIGLISFSFQSDKLLLRISDIYIQLMPLFEKQHTKQQNQKQQQTNGAYLNTLINSFLGQVEIIIENICFKVFTYDANESSLTYPSISMLLSKIAIVKNTEMKTQNNNTTSDFDIIDNIKPNEEETVLFLYGFNISIWNFCIKACENHMDEEKEFFNISKNIKEYNENDNAYIQMKNFFLKECTLIAIDNTKGSSIEINIPNKISTNNNIDININLNSIEIIIFPSQLHNLIIFSKICDLIYDSFTPPFTEKTQLTSNKLHFLGFDKEILNINFNMKTLYIILYEKMNNDMHYKKLYFYNKEPRNNESDISEEKSSIIKYYCYYDRNYYFFNIDSIKVNFQLNFANGDSLLKVNVPGITFSYINYLKRESNLIIDNNKDKAFVTAINTNNDSIINTDMYYSNENVYYNEFNILNIDSININQINNTELQINISNILLSFHLVVFFPLVNLLYSNILFPSKIKTKFNEEEYNKIHSYIQPIEVQPQCENKINQTYKNTNEKKENLKVKFNIKVDNIVINVYPFKRDNQRLDGNEFFYQYYSQYILPFISKYNGITFPQNLIDNTKSNSCLQVNISDIDINIKTNNNIELKLNDFILQYNSYKIIHIQKNVNEDPILFIFDLSIPNTTSISLSLTQKIIANIKPAIIEELFTFFDEFCVEMNILQIFMNFQEKIYNDNIDKLFILYNIKQFLKKETNINKNINENLNTTVTVFNINGFLRTISLNINSNNNDNIIEGNIIRIEFQQTKLNVHMKSDEEAKKVEIDIGNFKLGIRKHDINNNNTQLSHCWIITNIIEHNIPFMHVDLYYCNINKNRDKYGKEIPYSHHNIIFTNASIPKDKIFHNKEYEKFLLNHKLPKDHMKTLININIHNIYIESFYSNINDISSSLNQLISDCTTSPKSSIIPIIPLCEDSHMFININLQLRQTTFDFFKKGNHENLVQDFSRLLLILNTLSISISEDIISLSIQNISIFVLNNFQFIHKNIINKDELYSPKQHIPFIQNENSYLKRIGYIELLYLNILSIAITKSQENSSKTIIQIDIGNIDINSCKDCFFCCKELIIGYVIQNIMKLIESVFPKETEMKQLNEKNDTSISINTNKDIPLENQELKDKKSEAFQVSSEVIEKTKNKYQSKTLSLITETVDEDQTSEDEDIQYCNSDDINEDHEQKIEESEIIITFNGIRIILYKGRDFDFDLNNNDITNICIDKQRNNIQQQQSSLTSLEIDANYFKKSKHKLHSGINNTYTQRKRCKKRKYQHYISFILTKLKIHIHHKENDLSFNIHLSNMEIEDNIPQSKYSKVLSRYHYSTNNPFIDMSLSISNIQQTKNISLNFSLIPINILLDQNTLWFIIKYFLYDPSTNFEVISTDDYAQMDSSSTSQSISTMQNEPEQEIQLQPEDTSSQEIKTLCTNININDLYFNFSFLNHNLKAPKYGMEYLKYLNITNISELEIHINKYEFIGEDELEKQIECLHKHYVNSILKQAPSAAVHSVSFIKPFAKMVDGVFEIIKQPFKSYKSGKGIARGVGVGMKNFFFGFTGQWVFLVEKTGVFVKNMLIGRKGGTVLGKNSFYKQWLYTGDKKKMKYDNYFLKK